MITACGHSPEDRLTLFNRAREVGHAKTLLFGVALRTPCHVRVSAADLLGSLSATT